MIRSVPTKLDGTDKGATQFSCGVSITSCAINIPFRLNHQKTLSNLLTRRLKTCFTEKEYHRRFLQEDSAET